MTVGFSFARWLIRPPRRKSISFTYILIYSAVQFGFGNACWAGYLVRETYCVSWGSGGATGFSSLGRVVVVVYAFLSSRLVSLPLVSILHASGGGGFSQGAPRGNCTKCGRLACSLARHFFSSFVTPAVGVVELHAFAGSINLTLPRWIPPPSRYRSCREESAPRSSRESRNSLVGRYARPTT